MDRGEDIPLRKRVALDATPPLKSTTVPLGSPASFEHAIQQNGPSAQFRVLAGMANMRR